MTSKYQVEKLVKKYGNYFKEELNIKANVKFHVYKQSSKFCKKIKVGKETLKGITFPSDFDLGADIFLFYDNLTSDRDIISTIYHELLHVKLTKLLGLITLNINVVSTTEENIVRDLEEFFMSMWWDKK